MKSLRDSRQKGITLIALVVTIVVLVILATVSILAVFGDNGIIARAQTAKDTHEKGKADETNTLDDYASYIGNYLDGKGEVQEEEVILQLIQQLELQLQNLELGQAVRLHQ